MDTSKTIMSVVQNRAKDRNVFWLRLSGYKRKGYRNSIRTSHWHTGKKIRL
jgi:hypothetical protein